MKVLFEIFKGPHHVDDITKEVESVRDIFPVVKDLCSKLKASSYDIEDAMNESYYDADVKILIDLQSKVAHMEECADMYVNSEELLEQIQGFYPNASQSDLNYYLKKECMPIIPHLGQADFDDVSELCDTIQCFSDRDVFFTKSGVLVSFE